MSERIYVTENDRIEHYENNLVSLVLANGERFEALEPRRLFPVSRAEEYITLLDVDGNEAAQIRAIDELAPDSASVIRNSLSDYYLVPVITKISSVTEKYGTLHWRRDRSRSQGI